MQVSPVLVVGAGPVGLSAALGLTEAGVRVRVIDKLTEPTNQSRAAVVHARTLEMFERLGIVEDFLASGVRIHGAAVYGPGGKLLTRPNMDNMPTAYSYMLGLEQTHTESILAKHLNARGIAVERGVELLALEQSGDRVRVRLKYADGTEKNEEFFWIVGTDGARSTVRHALGLTLEGETLETTWLTADVKIKWDRSPDEALAYLTTEGFAFIAAMNDDRWRVIVNVHKMTKEEAEKVGLLEIQKIVHERFGIDAPLYDPVWISPFSINTRIAPTMYVDRVFLAGDASHVHSPVGGQGMNTGIQDALNLAWKLALVVQGQAKPEILESYNSERHENAKRLLRTVGPATKLINLRHPVPIELRNFAMHLMYELGLSAVMARNFSMLGVEYLNSPIVGEHLGKTDGAVAALKEKIEHLLPFDHAPRPGQRAPDAHAIVTSDGNSQRLFEIWKGDLRHQLLIFTGHGKSDALQNLRDLQQEFSAYSTFLKTWLVVRSPQGPDTIFDEELEAHGNYGANVPTLYLIRPDGYIAFRSQPADADALRNYLKKWFLL